MALSRIRFWFVITAVSHAGATGSTGRVASDSWLDERAVTDGRRARGV
jgi:hypothetical protein